MNSQPTPLRNAASSFSMEDFAKALEQHDYQFQKGQKVRGRVESYETDGAYVDIGGKTLAFVPIREASLRGVTDLDTILPLQEEREFLVIREQDDDGQITLSIRQLEEKKAWDHLAELQQGGQSFPARVTGINKGGVTVEVEGLRGFIPRSHLLEKENLPSLVGQQLTVTPLELSPENKKLVLSQRKATRSASLNLLEVGQLVEGTVSGIKPFGVFVSLEGITGLLHIKQISQTFVSSLEEHFKPGEAIKAIVINIDEGQGRVSLSTRLLENYPGEMLEKMSEVMDSAEARAERAKKQLTQG